MSGGCDGIRGSAFYSLHFRLDGQAQRRAALDRRLSARRDFEHAASFRLPRRRCFWCTADVGWITGHTYVCYGPLAVGATQVIFEGVPTYPRRLAFLARSSKSAKCRFFTTAPTAIRSLIKLGADLPKKSDLSSLRILGTVGEPINPEAWIWYRETVGGGRCPIVDTWWQTETGSIMISPLPGAIAAKPGSCTLPLPGIEAEVIDEKGETAPVGEGGYLVIKRPWPSQLRTIWGDPDRYRSVYYPPAVAGGRHYVAGDSAHRDKDGYFWIMGRIDDVLNVSGHRLGTMEIESALVAHPKVAEAAVVARPDDLTGEAIVAFVVPRGARPRGEEARALTAQLRDWTAKEIGSIAKPKEIRYGDNLPKTRSGKIMRRLLRALAKGEKPTQDTSTLENPGDFGATGRRRISGAQKIFNQEAIKCTKPLFAMLSSRFSRRRRFLRRR